MVFHPGHHELHGVTVVVETSAGVTHVARFDKEDARGIHLLNVATHDPESADRSAEEFLAATLKYGVRPERPRLVLSAAEVVTTRRLADLREDRDRTK